MSTILIIEDEIDTATPVKLALELEGIDADIARDGKEGIALFDKNEYDLVLLDLKMPGMSGEEVLSEIRKRDPFIDVIIYLNLIWVHLLWIMSKVRLLCFGIVMDLKQ